MCLSEAKRRLREELQARRRAVPATVRRSAGDAVARRLLAAPEFVRAARVAAYVALPDELPTDTLLRTLLDSNRTLLLPRWTGRDHLVFGAVRDLAALHRGRFGAWEPPAGTPGVDLGPEDLVLVPGVAFDRQGGRLGRGRGCYDRSLVGSAGSPLLIGLAFAFQIVEAVPVAPHDRRMDVVVTEREFVRIARSRGRREPGADPG